MLQIEGLAQGLEVFKTLGSEVRLKIVELLAARGSMSLNEIASALELTNGAVTSHVRKLSETGIIRIEHDRTEKGNQKLCSLQVDQVLLNIRSSAEEQKYNMVETEIPIGHYALCEVKPACGLIVADDSACEENAPQVFSGLERFEARLLWFHDGYIEYRIPRTVPENCLVAQLTLSFEISSADLMIPSVVSFFLEDEPLGQWVTFKNDSSRGFFTPATYRRTERQHGFLKMLVINQAGVYLDGVRIADGPSEKAMAGNGRELRFRIMTCVAGANTGGIALYGADFGNYRQDILARIHWSAVQARISNEEGGSVNSNN